MTTPGASSHDPILIVGAGPIGLALANLLGRERVPCVLAEKHTAPHEQSRAIGLTPPSLHLFQKIGVADKAIERGVPVTVVRVHDDTGEVGTLRFDRLPDEFPFILTLPQSDTVRILRDALADCNTVTFLQGTELIRVSQKPSCAVARVLRNGRTIDSLPTSWLIGCDGRYSTTREAAGFAYTHRFYSPSFAMGDYEDSTHWGKEARLFFTREGSLESFPLPGGNRRWVALLPPAGTEDPGGFLEEQIKRLAHVEAPVRRLSGPSLFRPERLAARTFVRGRVLLAGDAAHVMSPIGGQGMNTGFGDSALLAPLLAGLYRGNLSPRALAFYTRKRHRAFRIACRRNAAGMWLGTRTGRTVSRIRGILLRHILNRRAPSRKLARHFAMVPSTVTLQCRNGFSSSAHKRAFTIQLFSAISGEYPWMSRVLSLGRDPVWKRNLVQDLPCRDPRRCVDLACGNGDLAALLRDRFPDARITALDLSPPMVERARKRLAPEGIRCARRDMMRTELRTDSVDLLITGYGLRNAPDLPGALREMARIIKPNGYLAILEFSRYDAEWAARAELAILRFWGRLWGWLRTRNGDTYGYIAESLAAFPTCRAFHAMLRDGGFEIQSIRRGFFGFVEALIAVNRGVEK